MLGPRALGWLECLGLSIALVGCGPDTVSGNELGVGTESGSEATTGEPGETGEGPLDPCACGCVSAQSSYSAPRLLFVVDSSSSMAQSWDHDGDPATATQTRWASAQTIVAGLIEQWESLALIGLHRFPSTDACPRANAMTPSCTDASACLSAGGPEHALAWSDAASVIATMPGPDASAGELAGGSPAAAAHASAVAQLLAHRGVEVTEGPEYVVLVTDGHVNCGARLEPPASLMSVDDDLLAQIAAARAEHTIETFVIAVDEASTGLVATDGDSIPSFDPRPTLAEWATAGGTAPYMSASEPSDVYARLSAPDYVADCIIDLTTSPSGPLEPAQLALFRLTFDGEPLAQLDSSLCASESGWRWLDGAEGQVFTLCGAACDAMLDPTRVTTLEGVYGCPLPD